MSHFKHASLRTLGCALVAGSMLAASPVNAGVILLTSSTTTANQLSFTSTWNWEFTNNTWAAGPVTAVFGETAGVPPVFFPYWEVTLQGFDGGDLRDISRHLVAPHLGEAQPNVLSFFDYPGASAGVGPIVSFIGHPNHFDVYTLQTTVLVAGSITRITFSGEHKPTADGSSRTVVPEPSSLLLLGAGLAALLASRRRSSPHRENLGKE